MGKKIGGRHEAGGLYYLDGGGSSVALQTSLTPLQWHCRLGHPSLKALKILVSSLSHLLSLQCESCQYRKHHQVPFSPRVDSRPEVSVSSPLLPLPLPVRDPVPVVPIGVDPSPPPVQIPTERPPIWHVYTHRQTLAPPPASTLFADPIVAPVPELSGLDLPIVLRKEALSSPGWRKTMEEELSAIQHTQTWELSTLPPNKHVVDCKWVYTVKYLLDGNVKSLKARLVAKGYS
ncbi:PREDICTED: uncharacterized protein LOC109114069 [Nelumbo nucifera]|uniref:Uncharacterized protein LOC109114069 n=1 Tax=Nelumbo nucifera TaxID=4432 RepID=A0A1U8Q133_NELNU|nr:PREDICTED: uncharacterized protein LOC109114069 [Nelumbo nucifera]